MLTARQYADRYPGQLVKLAPKFAKEMGIKDDDKPIGIVVGFKPGQKGVIGSSKVAIFRDKLEARYGLEQKTKSTYHAVIPDPPHHGLGIYFLSVNCIELARPMKPVIPYPHTCGVCKSPARKGSNLLICSNAECKSKKTLLDSIGPIPKYYMLDEDKFVLCPVCQMKDGVKTREMDLEPSANYGSIQASRRLICRRCKYKFAHRWKNGHRLFYQGAHYYIWQDGQLKQDIFKIKKAK